MALCKTPVQIVLAVWITSVNIVCLLCTQPLNTECLLHEWLLGTWSYSAQNSFNIECLLCAWLCKYQAPFSMLYYDLNSQRRKLRLKEA